MSQPSALEILRRLELHRSLAENLQYKQIQRFLELIQRLWPEIVPPQSLAPVILPQPIVQFLASVLNLEIGLVHLLWHAFGDLGQSFFCDDQPSINDSFRVHGHEHELGAETIEPPMKHCPRPECMSYEMNEVSVVEARLYTVHRGILPVFSKSRYCRKCLTRYYHNYSVGHAANPNARREYYKEEDVPTFIHVTETSFVEKQLCIYFEKQMAISHSTCTAIARVYNAALGKSSVPNSSRLIHELTGELVLDSFLFHAILRDKRRRKETLSVPHHDYQNHRLDEALAERNYHMTGTEPLPSQKSHFCHTHRDLIKKCCINGCDALAQHGFRTCTLEAHREFQKAAEERNSAMFQLHSRLRKAGVEQVAIAGSTTDAVPSQQPANEAAPSESTGVKGRLSRNWTHNEQLFVRCCGVIISRTTFFDAEGITSVKDFLKATFPPEYPGSMPSYMFYDNNCSFLKHLRSCGDTYFDNENCNPAQFLELIGENGKWVFNSSAAEQANVWFGKFQNTVQEMPALRFNFFLDEMIALHNEETDAELTKQNQKPHLQDEALLCGEDM
ncbi:hypothetical protein C8R43DRAFT_1134848 [Mycena crocata]|nr:hypothetical protein C8R43DRAFT_1134848 [Mycena crocata]